MDKEFKTTFIPKKNLTQSRSETPRIKNPRTRSILGILSIIIFLSALVLTLGVFVYRKRVEVVINSRIESINLAEKAFEPSVILELRKLDIRLRSATELLEQHTAFSDFFLSFGESTLPDVAFNDFYLDNDGGLYTVVMTGEARGYLPIAQQSNLFEENRYIENPIFSEFSLNETGHVSFDLTFTLNNDLITFGRNADIAEQTASEADLEAAIIETAPDVIAPGTPVEFTN